MEEVTAQLFEIVTKDIDGVIENALLSNGFTVDFFKDNVSDFCYVDNDDTRHLYYKRHCPEEKHILSIRFLLETVKPGRCGPPIAVARLIVTFEYR